jgi:inositol-hexakisphosphate kinase
VWNTVTDSFSSKNKYRGREIKTSDFHRVLAHFLHDGNRLLVDHIPSIIQKLHNLAAIMLTLDGFRFYGCSLLLIYDGDKDVQDNYSKQAIITNRNRKYGGLGELEEEDEWVEIRHRPTRSGNPEDLEGDVQARTRRSKSVEVHSTSRSRHTEIHSRHSHDHASGHGHGRRRGSHDGSASSRKLRGEVNIRVVDFAHTTTGLDFIPFPSSHIDPPEKDLGKGYDTQIDPDTGLNMARFPPKHPNRPDMGFIYGLQSVCQALTGVWEEEVGREVVEGWTEGMENGDVFERAFDGGKGDGEVST